VKDKLPLPQEKKLMVIFRVEPGCLGPDGIDHIEKFCQYAEEQVADIDSDFVHWEIVPRFNKSLPELEYKVHHRNLSHDKAAKYLNIFEKSLDEFEEHLNEKLGMLIEEYLKR
jgi:hypothetical protein